MRVGDEIRTVIVAQNSDGLTQLLQSAMVNWNAPINVSGNESAPVEMTPLEYAVLMGWVDGVRILLSNSNIVFDGVYTAYNPTQTIEQFTQSLIPQFQERNDQERIAGYNQILELFTQARVARQASDAATPSQTHSPITTDSAELSQLQIAFRDRNLDLLNSLLQSNRINWNGNLVTEHNTLRPIELAAAGGWVEGVERLLTRPEIDLNHIEAGQTITQYINNVLNVIRRDNSSLSDIPRYERILALLEQASAARAPVPSTSPVAVSSQTSTASSSSQTNFFQSTPPAMSAERRTFFNDIIRDNMSGVQAYINQHQGRDLRNFLNIKNEQGLTPLMVACQHGRRGLAQLFLENKVPTEEFDRNRLTALHHAVSAEDIELVRLLLEHGVPIDQCDRDECTALHNAVSIGNQEIVELLLSKGADVNQKDNHGNTPLHYAADRGNRPVLDALLDAHPKLDIKNDRNKTPAEIAGGEVYSRSQNHQDIAAVLVQLETDRAYQEALVNPPSKVAEPSATEKGLRKIVAEFKLYEEMNPKFLCPMTDLPIEEAIAINGKIIDRRSIREYFNSNPHSNSFELGFGPITREHLKEPVIEVLQEMINAHVEELRLKGEQEKARGLNKVNDDDDFQTPPQSPVR